MKKLNKNMTDLDHLADILDKNKNAKLTEKDMRILKAGLIKMQKREEEENKKRVISYLELNIPFIL